MLFQLMLTGTVLILLQPSTARSQAADNCSTVNTADKYAAEIIKATMRAYRQQKTAQTMLHQLQLYTAVTTDRQIQKKMEPLKLLFTACAAAEEAQAQQLETAALPHLLNLAQALGTNNALTAVADAEVAQVTNTAHSGSAAYAKIELASSKNALQRTYCPIAELAAKPSIDGASEALDKWTLNIKKLQQVSTAAALGAGTAMCCVGNTGGVCQSGGTDHISVKGHKLFTEASQPVKAARLTKTAAEQQTWLSATTQDADAVAEAERLLDRLRKTNIQKGATCRPYNNPQKAFKDAVRLHILKKPFKEQLSQTEESEVTNTISSIYGKDENEFATKIWNKIETTKVHLQLDKKDTAVELKTLNNLQQLATAYTIAAATTKAQEDADKDCQKSSSEISEKTATNCNDKNKDECDKEASCEWKGSEEKGKCEAKEGVNAKDKKEEKV